jgi:hypothetical protein
LILALDLARRTGYALGEPGALLASGSVRFGNAGASQEAMFAAALTWAINNFKKWRPTIIVWESPMSRMWRGRASQAGDRWRGLSNHATFNTIGISVHCEHLASLIGSFVLFAKPLALDTLPPRGG